MTKVKPIATGIVEALAINGREVTDVVFTFDGSFGDTHSNRFRKLNNHDGEYLATSELTKGSKVFNWRSWTGLSSEEIHSTEQALDYKIPVGCLLENIRISGIPSFSKLAPTTRLVFPTKAREGMVRQVILAVWEENSPCKTVGKRLAKIYNNHDLEADFVRTAKDNRGVMGIVLSNGVVSKGDKVLVYPPVR